MKASHGGRGVKSRKRVVKIKKTKIKTHKTHPPFCRSKQIHTHTYTHAYIHTYVRTYVHTYIHTHIWICSRKQTMYMYGFCKSSPKTIRPTKPVHVSNEGGLRAVNPGATHLVRLPTKSSTGYKFSPLKSGHWELISWLFSAFAEPPPPSRADASGSPPPHRYRTSGVPCVCPSRQSPLAAFLSGASLGRPSRAGAASRPTTQRS